MRFRRRQRFKPFFVGYQLLEAQSQNFIDCFRQQLAPVFKIRSVDEFLH